jgi:hypothetical protein
MKRFTTLLLFLTSTLVSFSQNTTPADTSQNKNNSPTPAGIAAILPQSTAKSPTVAALGRYGEHPVSFYTGLPTIEIPIFSFQIGSLNVPIKLTYHAAGNRVNDRASWVGMGWSLQAGGMITRAVLGRPDEIVANGGVLSTSITDPNSFYNPACPNPTTDARMNDLANNLYDNQRDVFSYSLPDGNNSFIFNGSPTQPFLLMAEPVTIRSTTGLSSFTLTNAEGIRFGFTDTEFTTLNAPPANSYTGYTSAWLLNEITSLNTSDRALFSYYPGFSQNASRDQVDTQVCYTELFETNSGESNITPGPQQKTVLDAAPSVTSRNLSEINFPMGKIQFVRETVLRADAGYALDYIDVLGFQPSTNSFVRIKRFDLQHGIKLRTDGSIATFLDGIRLMGADLSVIGSYSFTYNATALPAVASLEKDYWGYFNGQTINTTLNTLIPAQTLIATERTTNPTPVTFAIGGANRNPNETLMKAWVLQSIRYPTGGSTQFDFEAHRYRDINNVERLAGGLRMQQIRSYTTDNELAMTKTYRYGLNESGAGTFRSALPLGYNSVVTNDFYQAFPTASPKDYRYKTHIYSSSPVYPLSPDEGSPVTYPQVSEYTENGSGGNIGRTVYTFRDGAADSFLSVGGGKGFLTSRRWDRGQLTSQTTYDNTGRMLTQELHSYEVLVSTPTAAPAGALVIRTFQQLGNVSGSPCLNGANQYLNQTYQYRQGLTKRIQTISYDYGSEVSTQFIQKTTQTDYSPHC